MARPGGEGPGLAGALQAVVGIDYYREHQPEESPEGTRAVRAALEDWRRDP